MIEDFGGLVPLNALVVSVETTSEDPVPEERTNKKIIPASEMSDNANVSLGNHEGFSFFIWMVIDACDTFWRTVRGVIQTGQCMPE